MASRYGRGRKELARPVPKMMKKKVEFSGGRAAEKPASPVLIEDDALMEDVGKITINGETFRCTESDIDTLGDLGEGSYGTVRKIRLKEKGIELAVKIMRDNIKEEERKSLVREISTIRQAQACPTIVDYYGLNFCEGDVWVYMELMEISLADLYRKIAPDPFPEPILAQFTVSIFEGLKYLKTELNVMHRDVKPSNTLMHRDGDFKLCDFGICNNLEKSLLHTSVGCSPYLSPERINPTHSGDSYGVESDVWSFGLTIVELGKLKYPYDNVEDDKNIFSLLQAIVGGEPPVLPGSYSEDFQEYTALCLIKDRMARPRYTKSAIGSPDGASLEGHRFYQRVKGCVDPAEVRSWYAPYQGGGAAAKP